MPDTNTDRKWLSIDNFTAGIWSAPGVKGKYLGAGYVGSLLAPQGACTDATHSCVPGPGGKGLVPGPGRPNANIDATTPEASFADANRVAPYAIVGVANMPGQINDAVFVSYRNTAGNMVVKAMSGGTQHNTLLFTLTSPATTAVPAKHSGMTWAWSRMATAAPYTAAGNLVLAFGDDYLVDNAGVFPDPTAPTVTAKVSFANFGRVLAHQNRVVLLRPEIQNWGGQVIISYGELIDFTDPANSNVMGTQGQVFYPENESGYGAWGSLSAGSLLLIKRAGGAVLVEGDIAAPRISYLPAVKSTGILSSRAAQTRLGVTYAVAGEGIWAWNGGASSVKISTALDDYFFRHNQTNAKEQFDTPASGPSVDVVDWGDFLLVSGGWMMHYDTGGWWRLSDSTLDEFLWYHTGLTSLLSPHLKSLQAFHPQAVLQSGTAGTNGVYRVARYFEGVTYANAWHWHSQPIRVTTTNDVTMSEIVLEAQASNDTGVQTIAWTIYGLTGVTQTGTATITAQARPERIRIPVSVAGDALEIALTATNATAGKAAPMLLALHIGYDESNLAPVG